MGADAGKGCPAGAPDAWSSRSSLSPAAGEFSTGSTSELIVWTASLDGPDATDSAAPGVPAGSGVDKAAGGVLLGVLELTRGGRADGCAPAPEAAEDCQRVVRPAFGVSSSHRGGRMERARLELVISFQVSGWSERRTTMAGSKAMRS